VGRLLDLPPREVLALAGLGRVVLGALAPQPGSLHKRFIGPLHAFQLGLEPQGVPLGGLPLGPEARFGLRGQGGHGRVRVRLGAARVDQLRPRVRELVLEGLFPQ